MLQRFAATAVTAAAVTAASLTVLATAPTTASADSGSSFDLPPLLGTQDRLTVTVTGAGDKVDGTYRLECAPDGGTHPNAEGACRRLERLAEDGENPFAPTPERSSCTMIYGGPATAHVTGLWQGRTVDARFERANGCEVSRWNTLVPLLPSVGPTTGSRAGV